MNKIPNNNSHESSHELSALKHGKEYILGKTADRIIGFFVDHSKKLSERSYDVAFPDTVDKAVIAWAPHMHGFVEAPLVFHMQPDVQFPYPMAISKIENHRFLRFVKPFVNYEKIIYVDRAAPAGIVEQIVERLDDCERATLFVAPEGTRNNNTVGRKKGFYNIATMADMPIIVLAFDYEHKRVVSSDPIYPSGDIEKDMQAIQDFFAMVIPEYKVWLR